jgi:Holliday junction resolvasome RuvABC endonuclease subunit
MILGLDVSTSCTGWSVIRPDGSLVAMGIIELSKKKSLYAKASLVRASLNNILVSHTISTVYIEENLQAFRRGFSSAKTLSTLARFNGVVSLISYEVFCVEPVHINVNFARKSLGIKILREKVCGTSTKDQVLKWVDTSLSGYTWPTKTLKSGPRKGQTILDVKSYDMADAYVVGMAGLKMNM